MLASLFSLPHYESGFNLFLRSKDPRGRKKNTVSATFDKLEPIT